MDNLCSHKAKKRPSGHPRRQRNADLPAKIPIEQVFAKLKHLLRKPAARTPDAVCAAIAEILDAFSPEECANYFAKSGYERS